MNYTVKDIVHENGDYFVIRCKAHGCYYVMKADITHSASDSAYSLDPDGMSIAIARCDYLSNRHRK